MSPSERNGPDGRDAAALEIDGVGAARPRARADVETSAQQVAAGFDRVRSRDLAVDVPDLKVGLGPEEVIADAAEHGEGRAAIGHDGPRPRIERAPVGAHPADHHPELIEAARHDRPMVPGEEVVVIVHLQTGCRQREPADEADVVMVGVVAEQISERRDLRRGSTVDRPCPSAPDCRNWSAPGRWRAAK